MELLRLSKPSIQFPRSSIPFTTSRGQFNLYKNGKLHILYGVFFNCRQALKICLTSWLLIASLHDSACQQKNTVEVQSRRLCVFNFTDGNLKPHFSSFLLLLLGLPERDLRARLLLPDRLLSRLLDLLLSLLLERLEAKGKHITCKRTNQQGDNSFVSFSFLSVQMRI